MAETTAVRPAGKREIGRLKRWLLKGRLEEMEGPHEREGQHHQHPWWMVIAQAGAYATGVLVLMGSAAVAVSLAMWRRGEPMRWAFLLISLIFLYTTVINVLEQPEGIKIASFFIGAIVFTSLTS